MRWTQFEEDAYRLPEGMKRTGYDADTQVYSFRDRKGTIYHGAPGADYGVLTPISNEEGSSRPEAFDFGQPRKEPLASGGPPSTFRDILPANFLTTPSSSVDARRPRSPKSPKSPEGGSMHPRARFVVAVRRSTMPKMQGVVHGLRRSLTTARAKQPSRDHETTRDNADFHLLDPSSLSRSASMATTRSSVSQDSQSTISVDRRMSTTSRPHH